MAKTRFEDNDLWVDIDLDLCTGAGECVEVCPEDCYEVVNGKVNAKNIGACIECAACDGVCPNDAILDHCSW
ncbi:MAG: ATP-binding protein [Candidatus Hodarchaeales archaeon]